MLPYSFAPATTIKSAEVNENLRLLSHSGLIAMWPSDSIPDGWLLCDGSSLLRATYPDLYAAIGTTFGSADGTHFNVPNLKGRVAVGKDGSQTEFDAMGETGGAKTHTLTSAEMPSHTHIQDAHTHVQNAHNHGVTDPGHTLTQTARSSAGSGVSIATASSGGTVGTWGAQDTQYTGISIQNATPTNQNTVATNQSTGGGGAHNNLQPYIVLNYIIKI